MTGTVYKALLIDFGKIAKNCCVLRTHSRLEIAVRERVNTVDISSFCKLGKKQKKIQG